MQAAVARQGNEMQSWKMMDYTCDRKPRLAADKHVTGGDKIRVIRSDLRRSVIEKFTTSHTFRTTVALLLEIVAAGA